LILGQEFLRHLKEAIKMDKKHTQLFEQFSATFQPNTIIAWEKLINAWKKNRSQPNPYLEPSPCKLMVFIQVLLSILMTMSISYNLTGCPAGISKGRHTISCSRRNISSSNKSDKFSYDWPGLGRTPVCIDHITIILLTIT
jgi:hypothetical protein